MSKIETQKSLDVELTDAQMITATSTLMAAADALREDTVGADIGDRELHVLLLLGSRFLLTRNGCSVEAMTATRLKTAIISNFDVSPPSADKTMQFLKDEGLTETVTTDGDKRVRIVKLTELGVVLYEKLARRNVNLVLAAAEMIERDGPLPVSPFERVKRFISDYARHIRACALPLALASTMSVAVSVTDAEAGTKKKFYDEGLTVKAQLDQGELVNVAMIFTD